VARHHDRPPPTLAVLLDPLGDPRPADQRAARAGREKSDVTHRAAPRGFPRAGRVAAHPGIVLSFDSKHGALSYPCDTFDRWEDNLRAIALALEALRKVDRYGVTAHGEQYRGFMAIEATAAPAEFASADAAFAFLEALVDGWARRDEPARLLRGAMRLTHPDHGGRAADFQRVSLAEAKLREAGLL
jgi:hypothetical protein